MLATWASKWWISHRALLSWKRRSRRMSRPSSTGDSYPSQKFHNSAKQSHPITILFNTKVCTMSQDSSSRWVSPFITSLAWTSRSRISLIWPTWGVWAPIWSIWQKRKILACQKRVVVPHYSNTSSAIWRMEMKFSMKDFSNRLKSPRDVTQFRSTSMTNPSKEEQTIWQ